MSTAHVIVGTTGEYSDRRVWTVAVYRDQAEARAEVERLDGQWRLWAAKCDADEDYTYEDQCIADAKSIDPQSDPPYGSYDYRPAYHIEEVPLR